MQKLQEREQQFKALFEVNSDLVTFVNTEGIVVDVNPAVASFLGKERQEIVNRPVSDFLPADALAKSNDRHQEAIKGKQVRYETEVALGGYGRRIFDLKKIPVVVNSEIIGAYTIAKDITATEKYHKTIQQQAKKFSAIFESITDAFFALDRDWNFTYVNSQLERIFPADRKDLIGKNIWQFTPPKLREKFYKKFQDSVKEVKPVDFEIYYDKSDLWFQVKAFPSKEGLSVYFDDITEKVKYKQELEKLSLVASKTINGVMILDAKGKIEWVNDSFTRLTGFTLFEVKGKYPGSLLEGAETDPTASNRIKERLRKGKPFTEEILRYKTSGEKLWVLLNITPVKNNVGEVINFVALQTDITFKKEAEASQLQLTQDLYKRNSDLQHFSYIISHNLRSPVATAMGLVELLTNMGKSSADFDKSLGYLKRSIHKIDTVLNDLHAILSAQDHKDTTKEVVDLASVCQQAIEEQQESLKRSGGEVSLVFEEGISAPGKRAYFYSVFHNLLSNAIKYRSPERALEINIQCISSKEKGIIISFSDNGLGFDMKSVGESLFKLYKRFHHSMAEGRGIGMFLDKSHVEAMGGHIEVESEVKVGTKFFIYF